MAAFAQGFDADGQAGFQAVDAEGGMIELALFFMRGVRGVIRGDEIDGAVFQTCDQGVQIFPRAADDERPSTLPSTTSAR